MSTARGRKIGRLVASRAVLCAVYAGSAVAAEWQGKEALRTEAG